jgi:hypothetical protein
MPDAILEKGTKSFNEKAKQKIEEFLIEAEKEKCEKIASGGKIRHLIGEDYMVDDLIPFLKEKVEEYNLPNSKMRLSVMKTARWWLWDVKWYLVLECKK